MQVIKRQAEKTTLVLGLGATGESCLEFLSSRVKVKACDDNLSLSRLNDLQQRFPEVDFKPSEECVDLSGVNELVASPGIADSHAVVSQAVGKAIPVICDIELFARHEKNPVIAITGTNGKSTVVSWLQHVLNACGRKCALGGNIGVPALNLLTQEHDCTVLELSSFQLERTYNLSPLIALILNISSDHLDRYKDIKGYQLAKERIYQNARIAIVNRDAGEFEIPESVSQIISFGLQASDEFGVERYEGEEYLTYQHDMLLAVNDLPLIGRHNVSNALAVLACAFALDIKPAQTAQALLGFKGLPHRTELVATVNGVRYINDSKATNAGATLAAVSGDLKNIVLVAGGDAKNADLLPLASALIGKLKACVLLGKNGPQLADVLRPVAPCYFVESIEESVSVAAEISENGDTVLLSPACSSLDMFKNYIERGERFSAAVRGLAT